MQTHRITSAELRRKYIAFFEERGHTCIPSTPLVPEGDPSALFIAAGMQPLVPYLLGARHPSGTRLVNVQKCFRTSDIDLIGNATHLTFLEMLGNWSLGDYFKEHMIPWSWTFLTGRQWLAIDPHKLYITVFAGDAEVGRDQESIALWQEQFAGASIDASEGERIFPLGREDNWWGPVGQTGPCGPDTEMFYDTGKSACSAACQPGCHCGKYVEIWNDVFMEYNKLEDGTYMRLQQSNVDTGMGLARTVAVLNGLDSIYEIDSLCPLIEQIGHLSGLDYPSHCESFRILADHATAACHLIADGVVPANVEQGYVLRRLIRRAAIHARRLGIEASVWPSLCDIVQTAYGEIYPNLTHRADEILDVLTREEELFGQTLQRGLSKFNQLLESGKVENGIIDGGHAFDLFATYGFPLEMTLELARERGLSVDEPAFQRQFARHQESSRQSATAKFSGGLADHSEMSTKYHTATHLLHAALRKVLGPHVEQRGSNITSERLRFDFSHPQKVESAELEQVEHLINNAIDRDYPVHGEEMDLDKALESGAIGLFGEKYAAHVKVFTIGDPAHNPNATPDSPTFSKEICGGPHIEHTGLLGSFKIVREQSASRGVRRLRAILED